MGGSETRIFRGCYFVVVEGAVSRIRWATFPLVIPTVGNAGPRSRPESAPTPIQLSRAQGSLASVRTHVKGPPHSIEPRAYQRISFKKSVSSPSGSRVGRPPR